MTKLKGVERAVCEILSSIREHNGKYATGEWAKAITKELRTDLTLELCKSLTDPKHGAKLTDRDYDLARQIQRALEGKGHEDR